MNSINNDRELKKNLKVLGVALGFLYVSIASSMHLHLGADSPISRYLTRHFVNMATEGAVKTEEQYRKYLKDNRLQIAAQGNVPLAKILTFPWSPHYEGYREEGLRRLRDYNEKEQLLFGDSGLADTNNDGVIDINEKADAFRRMGLENRVQFPKPTLDDFEIAIRSYETK